MPWFGSSPMVGNLIVPGAGYCCSRLVTVETIAWRTAVYGNQCTLPWHMRAFCDAYSQGKVTVCLFVPLPSPTLVLSLFCKIAWVQYTACFGVWNTRGLVAQHCKGIIQKSYNFFANVLFSSDSHPFPPTHYIGLSSLHISLSFFSLCSLHSPRGGNATPFPPLSLSQVE